MAVDPQVRRVLSSHQSQVAEVRRRVLAFVTSAWGTLDSWRDADIERFVRAVVPAVAGGQVRVAALTDAYVAAVESALLGTRARPVGLAPSSVSDARLRGTEARDVYRRVGPTVWMALEAGKGLGQAVTAGLNRARGMAATDLQLAKTHAARSVFAAKANVVGFRRTLTGTETCGLCAVASTQRYKSDQLMPIHGGCDCGVMPIFGDRDPGQVIDPETLSGVHERIAERFGSASEAAGEIPRSVASYRDVLVTHEHGELGPVLAVRGHNFTAASDLD